MTSAAIWNLGLIVLGIWAAIGALIDRGGRPGEKPLFVIVGICFAIAGILGLSK